MLPESKSNDQERVKKQVAILGSTGSIGKQTLEVIQAYPDHFEATVLTAFHNADLLIEQALAFLPQAVVIADNKLYNTVKDALSGSNIEVHSGHSALVSVVQRQDVNLVLMALVGYSGLLPTMEAIKAGKTIALANKETLVVAGKLITELAKKQGVMICPVDSEHSAIFQCLLGEAHKSVEKIILTASGGPFRGKSERELHTVTRAQALNHPNWVMGDKVTIDSATLMNKGLEVIEAKWLFDMDIDQLEVVVHPQSIIHSLVQFRDGSIKAQLSLPDMRLPIQFAMSYPERLSSNFGRFEFNSNLSFTFEQPDTQTFRNLALAYEALRYGGNKPCVLNAANEVAVSEFLQNRIGFLDIPRIVARCMEEIDFVADPEYEDYVATDRETKMKALELTRNKLKKYN